MLVSKGASDNAKDSSCETPLHYAASYGNKAIATHLVDNGGDLTIASSDGTTPAQVADLSGHTEVETYLESKTPRPDLVVQSPSVDNSTPGPGESLTVSATVRNSGTGSSASTTLRYYQSSDATISTGDTEVGTADAIGELAASATSAQSLSLTAPSSAGTYYYGACVASVSGESDTNNNCSAGVQVTVVAPPDLVVQSPSVDNSTPGPGESLTVSATVRNSGTGSSASTTLRYYQSSDATISTGDTEVGTDSVDGLAASATSAQSLSLTAPSSAGTYYYGACVASVSNESDTNNNCSAGVQVTVVAPPDLVVQSPSVDNSTPGPGESLTVSATVRNSGTGSSASTTLRYYQSSDATISTGDTEVGTDSVDGLAASATSAQSLSLTAPSSAGTYYYGACVASVSGESDTNNNCSAGVSVTVTLSPEQQARAALDSRGIAYTAGAFIDSARSGNLAVVKLFVQAGMSVETREDDYNRTALHWAAHGGRLEVVKYLVGQGASLTATGTAYSRTPLHLAARWGHLETVKYLVGAGANVNATDTNGRTPWGLARHHGQTAVVEYLGPKTALADLVVSASVDNSTPTAGQSLTLSATVRNQGTGSSASTTLRYYRSTDATITTGDTEVGSSDAVSGLAASGTSAQSSSVTAPSSAGTYYYGACVASVSGESDTNNNCSAGVQVTVVAPPDLVVSASVDNSTPTAGQSLTLSATVRNQGTGSSASTTLRYYRSTDATITTGDTEVGSSDAVSGLAASGTSAQSSSVTAPSSAGTYYYGACVGSVSSESDTNNNCSAGVQVTVVAPPDLVVSASVDNSTPTAGQSLTLSATVRNQGTGSSASTTLRYYRSTDATITTGDTEVGSSDAVGALAASGTSAQSSSVTAPSSTGTYYYGACVAAVTGESNSNNNCSAGVSVTVMTPQQQARAALAGRGISYNAAAFIAAARDGNLAVVKLFVTAGMSVKTAATNGSTVLHYAAWKGHLSVVQYLVGQGANVNAMNNVGWTPMNDARSAGHTAVVTYLKSVGGIAYTADAFIAAARDGNLAVVKLFVTAGWSVETAATNGSTVLHYAAWKGHLSVVQYLVGQGANVLATNNVGWTPRDDARSAGHTAVVTYLESEARAELDSRGIAYTANAFVDSASAGNLAVVKLFVQAGMDIDATDSNSVTALLVASVWDHLAVVQYLVEQGADVNFRNTNGTTALHEAAALGHLEVVKYLVGQGADITATDNNDVWTPLHSAAYSGRLEVVKYLVEQGADITATDINGRTARSWTASQAIYDYLESAARAELERLGFSYTGAAFRAEARAGNLAGVRLFVESGMSVEIREHDTLFHWRPLHLAAYYGHLDVVIHLVRAGANIRASVHRGPSWFDPRGLALDCAGKRTFAAERRENCRSVMNYFDSLDDDDE